MRWFRFISGLCTLVLFAAAIQTARAQDDPNFEAGMKPYGSYHAGKIDTIDLLNGSLTVDIPLMSYPQRGGKLALDLALHYENRGSYLDDVCYDDGFGGESCWLYGPSKLLHGFNIIQKSAAYIGASLNIIYDGGWYEEYETPTAVKEATGPLHVMEPASLTYLAANDGSGYAQSGSGYYTLLGPDGTQYQGSAVIPGPTRPYDDWTYGSGYPDLPLVPTSVEDANGNKISYSSSSGWTDTVGRSIGVPTSTSTSNCPSGTPSPSSAWIWDLPGVSGVDSGHYYVLFCSITMPEEVEGDVSGSPSLQSYTATELQSVVLPNGTAWTFQYDTSGPGDLTQITFPTGGTLAYEWTAGPSLLDTNTYNYPRAVHSRTVNDGVSSVSSSYDYSGDSGSGTATSTMNDGNGNDSVHTFTFFTPASPNYDNLFSSGYFETQTKFYQGSSGSGTLLKTVNTSYTSSQTLGLPSQVTTIWPNGQQSKVTHTYDSALALYYPMYDNAGSGAYFAYPSTTFTGSYGRELTTSEYDYGSGAPGSLIRTTTTNYLALSNSSYMTNNLLNLPSSVQVTDSGSTPRAYTTYTYDGTSPGLHSSGISTQHDSSPPAGTYRGNLTSQSRWLNVTSGYLTDYKTYNDTGTIYESVDANGSSATDTNHMTSYAYESTGTFPNQITYPPTGSTTHIEQFNYDVPSGVLNWHKDQNSSEVDYTYDVMRRLTWAGFPSGQGLAAYTYYDTSTPYFVFTKPIKSGLNFIEVGHVDGVGRLKQTVTYVPVSTCSYQWILVDTTYDGVGNKSSVSNPYCTTGDTTYGVTTYSYDGLNRVTKVIPPDGSSSSNNMATSYSGSCSTTTDQAAKARKSCTDGLGRMTGVWEDPSSLNYETDYGYDVLDNLTSVSQSSSRSRTFAYDSLSRLVSASNPESNTVCYGTVSGSCQQNGYDGNGNLIYKTDARGILTTYAYDALNRLTSKTYSNSDPSVNYTYDGVSAVGCTIPGSFSYGSYPKPHRTAMCDAAGNEAWSYDLLGKALKDQRTTNSVTKTTTYTYNYDETVYSITYPSGSTIVYAPNTADQPANSEDTTNSINYAYGPTTCPNGQSTSTEGSLKGVCYTPPGSVASLMNGSNLTTKAYYSNRLQPCRIAVDNSGGSSPTTPPTSCGDATSGHGGNVLDYTYSFDLSSLNSTLCSTSFSSPTNNGNVASITNNVTSTRSQYFCYDSLNRITQAQTTSTYGTSSANCWRELYTDDAWGNLTAIAQPSGTYPTNPYGGCMEESGFSITVNSSNQITTSGFGYDSSGNLTGMPVAGGGSLTITYNAENQAISDSAPGGLYCYTYDGDGHRLLKSKAQTGYTCTSASPNNPTVNMLYWMNTSGDTTTETNSGGTLTDEYIFFGGKRIARRDSSNNVDYYLADHLGTARVVTNSSGAVQDDSDFYPYGVERPVTGPSSGNTYKFTGKERDSESGLDNFGARYDSSQYGRFMTPDDIGPGQHPEDPQTWNMYSYVRNNPLSLVDPTGQYICDSNSVSQQQCDNFQAGLDKAQQTANNLKSQYGADSDQYKNAQGAIDAYGKEGVDNGVTIAQGSTGNYAAQTQVAGTTVTPTDNNPNGQNIRVTLNQSLNLLGGTTNTADLGVLEAHEGSHVADASAWVSSGFSASMNPTGYQTEFKAYQVSANLYNALGYMAATVSFAGRSYLLTSTLPAWASNYTTTAINGIIKSEYPNANLAAFSRNTKLPRR